MVPPAPARSFPRPTLRVVLALVVLAGVTLALRLRDPVVVAAALGLAAAWSVDAIAVRRGDVTFRTRAPATIVRGKRDAISVRVDGPARLVRLRQPSPPELVVEPSEAGGPTLEATLTGTYRGSFALLGAVARLEGPLGLASVDVQGAAPPAVAVLPDLPRARRLSMRRRGRTGAEGAAVRRLGIGTEFESVREYDENDDVRFVNWMATSRCARPMTNQFRMDENRDLCCLVDTGRLMCAPAGTATRLDVALDALCVLGVAADDAGDRVGATAFAGGMRRSVAPRRRGTAEVVEALYDLQPIEVDSDFALAFQQLAVRKRSIVVVFTDLVDPAASRSLVDALPVLERRHEVLVASSLDEELAAMAVAPPREYADVARAAAALRLLDEHRAVVRRLAALRAQVVVAAPHQLGTACVTAYARLKSLARV
ncbi:MAG TPA: DUF58 domain-containing protein [Acidimicrobiales bacterium]|nr:DUF58 domain-containing protein [Acidimicrobiales bacterium]